MTKMKRFIASVLCLAMLLSVVPFGAFATETEEIIDTVVETEPAEQITEIPETVPATEAPAEEPTEAPAEEPTEAPAEEPTEAPAEEPMEIPAEEQVDVAAPEAEAEIEAVADSDVARIGDIGYATLADAVAAAAAGDTIYLLKNTEFSATVTVTKKITITAESEVTATKTGTASWLTINAGGDVTLEGPVTVAGTKAYGALIEVNKGVLTMNNGVTLRDNETDKATTAGGVNIKDGTFVMNGGTISNCKTTNSSKPGTSNGGGIGGAVRVSLSSSATVNASFTMNGGTITGCSAYSGGAVGVENIKNSKKMTASFVMNGGTITGCSETGGNNGGAAVLLWNIFPSSNKTIEGATFTMNGGRIVNNTGKKYGVINPGYNGLTSATAAGHIYILGGEISGNFVGTGSNNSPSSFYGNGIYLANVYSGQALLTVGGNAVIDDEIFIANKSGNFFEVRDGFTGTAKLFSQTGGNAGTHGTLVAKSSSGTATAAVADKLIPVYSFLSNSSSGEVYEHPSCGVVVGTNAGEYVLGEKAPAVAEYTVTYTDGVEGEEIFADQVYTVAEGEATPAFEGTPAREGYTFIGWEPAVAETVTDEATYVAQWEKIPEYTVTYTDGVEGEEIFADQVYTVAEGEATPAFVGEPVREGYTFLGWTPEVAETVTEGVTYIAQWEKIVVYVAELASTGEKFETLQAALDAAKIALEAGLEADKITLLNNTTECASISWARGADMTLTIDLNGYTVTGDGTAAVLTVSGLTSLSGRYHIVIDDSSEAKTGTITGGVAKSGGAIFMDGLKANDSLTINGGNFVKNTATSTGGALYSNVVGARIYINGGTFTGNTAKSGGAISACSLEINGGLFTGNTAEDTATFSGRGGAIVVWGTGAVDLKVTGGQIYGNTASRYGDDIVFCTTKQTTAKMSLLNAADMGIENVNAWCIDGYYGSFTSEANLTDRYSADNAVAFDKYADFSGSAAKGIAVALKAAYVAPKYTVTYTDGVEDAEIFADQVFTVNEGEATPAFEGTPARDGYEFLGWEPAVAETVTADATYVAQWKEIIYAARLESTGEQFMTLQAAIDAASALIVDADNENQTVTLLSDVKESVKITWSTGSATGYNFNLTIDLNGYTVTGNGGTVFDISRLGSGAAQKVMTVIFNDSVGTGVVTGGNNTYGGAIYNSTAKGNINIVINGGTWTGNTATSSGGAISSAYTTGTTVTINGGVFKDNTAGSNGGAIYARNLVMTGGTITGNTAKSGGGVYVFINATTTIDMTGGAIYGNTATTDGDDIIWRANRGTASTAYMKLIDAATMPGAEVTGWYVDNADARFSADNAVVFENYAKYTTISTRVCLKAAKVERKAPALPENNGSNVTNELITIVCDTDEGHISKTYGWADPAANFVFPNGAEPVWNEELNAWTISVRIDSIQAYYVGLRFNDTCNGIQHEVVMGEPLTSEEYKRIDTTLVWNNEAGKWQTLTGEPFQVHVTCQTKPEAPQMGFHLGKFQIKMVGDVNGEEKIWHESLHAETVTVGEVKGNRVDGFTVDVTVTLDDSYLAAWADKHAAGMEYAYDENAPETVVFTMKYTGDAVGELYDGPEFWAADGESVYTVHVLRATPAAPDKFGKNVTPELIKVICDSDEAHAPIAIKWQSQSTKVRDWVSGVVWSEEENTWVVPVRIDGISGYYVWQQFDKVYNNIEHTMLDEDQKCIDTYLKWDEAKQLWVTLDEQPIDVHVCCKTTPDAPTTLPSSFQIQVKGDLDRDGIYGETQADCSLGVSEMYAVTIPAGGYTLSEVYGNRQDGFFTDVTVNLEDGDIYISTWIGNRAPGGDYVYNWDKTEKTVTFTLKYNRSLTSTLYGSNRSDWAATFTGYKVGEAFVDENIKQVTVTYTDGVEGKELFADQVYTAYVGDKTPAFEGTPANYGHTFAGWTPEVAETVTADVTYTAQWTVNSYTITLDGNGVEVENDAVNVTFGEAVGQLPTLERTLYTFAGWFDANGKQYTAETIYDVAEDITLTTKWIQNAPEKPYKIVNVVSGVHVYWTAVEGSAKYGVWRSETGKDGTWKWLGNPTVNHFTDTKAESGKTYYYAITTYDSETNTHSAKSPAISIIYVATPDITLRVNREVGVGLRWDKIEGATGYAIYRKSFNGNDSWVRIATIEGNETFAWNDTSVQKENGTVYRYTIRALAGADMKTLSGCRNTGRTMVRLTTRQLTSAVKASSTSIKCTWMTSSVVDGYEVRFMVDGEVYKTFTIGNYKTGVKTFTGLDAGKTYKIQVRGYKKVDGVGTFYSAWSTAINVGL